MEKTKMTCQFLRPMTKEAKEALDEKMDFLRYIAMAKDPKKAYKILCPICAKGKEKNER